MAFKPFDDDHHDVMNLIGDMHDISGMHGQNANVNFTVGHGAQEENRKPERKHLLRKLSDITAFHRPVVCCSCCLYHNGADTHAIYNISFHGHNFLP